MRKNSINRISCTIFFLVNSTIVVGQINTYTLSIVDSIGSTIMNPPEERLTLSNPNGACIDGDGNIFVLDSDAYKLYKFNQQLKLIKAIGKNGSGPLEFLFPTKAQNSGFTILDLNDNVYVYDVTAFQGKLIKNDLSDLIRVNRFTSFILDLCVGEENNIYAVCPNSTKSTLIDMYDKDGKYLKSFCDIFIKNPLNERIMRRNQSLIAANKHGELLLVNRYDPTMRKFNEDGDLLFEKKLDLSSMIKDERLKKLIFNNAKLNVFDNHALKKGEALSNVIRDICADGDFFYFLLAYDNIIKIHRNGDVLAIYELDHGPYIQQKTFYILAFDISKNRVIAATSNGLGLLYKMNE